MRSKALETRLDAIAKRAAVKRARPIVLVDTLSWPDEDRDAYRFGDEGTRSELVAKYYGEIPESSDPLGFSAIIVALTPMRTEEL